MDWKVFSCRILFSIVGPCRLLTRLPRSALPAVPLVVAWCALVQPVRSCRFMRRADLEFASNGEKASIVDALSSTTLEKLVVLGRGACRGNPLEPFDIIDEENHDGLSQKAASWSPLMGSSPPGSPGTATRVTGMHAVLELPGNPSDSAQRGAVALLTGDAPRPWEWGYDALAVAEATEGHALYLTANTCFERLHLVAALGLDSTALSCYLWEAEQSYCFDAHPPPKRLQAQSQQFQLPGASYASTIFRSSSQTMRLEDVDHQTETPALDWRARQMLNPYHHSGHAADVTSAAAHFLCSNVISARLTATDVGAVLFAAAMHDFRHPALSNNYILNAASAACDPVWEGLATTYNDISILESMHAAEAFRLLRKPNANFIATCTSRVRRRFRKIAISCILATDLARAGEFIGKFEKELEKVISYSSFNIDAEPSAGKPSRGAGSGDKDGGPVGFQDDAAKIALAQMIVKVSDVSHPARQWKVHSAWTSRIQEEFAAQGARERRTNLPVSPLCDVSEVMPKAQLGFIDFVVKPCVTPLAKLCSAEGYSLEWLEQLNANRREWQRLHKEQAVRSTSSGCGDPACTQRRSPELAKVSPSPISTDEVPNGSVPTSPGGSRRARDSVKARTPTRRERLGSMSKDRKTELELQPEGNEIDVHSSQAAA